MDDHPFRVLPALDDGNRFFWASGADGVLRFERCDACHYWIHPPAPYCPQCGGRATTPDAVSGRGTVWSFTVNHHSWDGSTDPYAIVLVELDDQAGLRLTSNLVGCDPSEAHIGMRVEVVFDEYDDGVWYPLFRPVSQTTS